MGGSQSPLELVNMLSIEIHAIWDPPVKYGAFSESHNHKTNT